MLFKKKLLPTVSFNGIMAEVIKDGSIYYWKFTYKDVDFYTEDHAFEIPTIETLDKYLSWIESNKDQINVSIIDAMKHWEVNVEAAKNGGVTIQSSNKISVLFIGDDWGDMGGDFVIENGVITDEGWGD
jgi:hypothetical protein